MLRLTDSVVPILFVIRFTAETAVCAYTIFNSRIPLITVTSTCWKTMPKMATKKVIKSLTNSIQFF